ncbi:MAG TPA: type II toxin-antitoxin system prevent-host-death family antitoxin [Phenylobacterium sp.]|uniref:type II toxin-antitoxin system Phd/YefM family antitoxin n=1 Tax=Phenylobacterium sp. TaxID=1871053 RepID=UPI002D09B386|nr:type II toxin-antitoxin system prevent-host-death family antitoxin [Phenylobacterium sp.]HSV03459.1 type II toxin-antitoxin system prevent-host-death family antitoxin [Phenylobacterium sp.]
MVVSNIHQAKTNLSKLIEKAEAGEEVVIARNGKPAVRLVPVEKPAELPRRPDGLPGWMGSLKGQIWIAPDFDEPDEELIRAFEEGEMFPPDDDEHE